MFFIIGTIQARNHTFKLSLFIWTVAKCWHDTKLNNLVWLLSFQHIIPEFNIPSWPSDIVISYIHILWSIWSVMIYTVHFLQYIHYSSHNVLLLLVMTALLLMKSIVISINLLVPVKVEVPRMRAWKWDDTGGGRCKITIECVNDLGWNNFLLLLINLGLWLCALWLTWELSEQCL